MMRISSGRAFLVGGFVLAAAAGGWWYWPQAAARLGEAPEASAGLAASPELAEATLDRIEGLRAADGGQLALGAAELTSVVRYALPGILPPGVSEPGVTIESGTVTVSARLATAAIPDLPALGQVIGMLPDTVPVRIEGKLSRYGKESMAFFVSQVEAARIPLPDRLVPQVLGALGRQERKGLPANALHIPMPGGLDSVYVARDSLVLVADR